MRRHVLIILGLFLFASGLIYGQDENANVISYYAVTNSLDGQPMVDMMNVLRFYPVYAMRSQIDTVNVTIYIGPDVYTRPAHEFEDGRYWQVLLPKFNLGEAIQRIEVESVFRLPPQFQGRLGLIRLKNEQLRTQLDSANLYLQMTQNEFNKSKPQFRIDIVTSNNQFKEIGISPSNADKLRQAYELGEKAFTQFLDSLISKGIWNPNALKDTLTAYYLAQSRSEKLHEYVKAFDSTQAEARREKEQVYLFKSKQELAIDSVKRNLTEELEVGLTDTSYIGPSVRSSDLIIDDDFKSARILYRNYKGSLRMMPSLDPAERMGIFRIRYVPFPIVGTDDNPRMNLKRPFATGSPAVFEVGLAFGDALVPGDDFVVPAFSWQRLGIAFAITQQLFSDSAQVLALAVTYDFNSYGSIGFGANFAGKAAHSYMSFGINKKAFDELIKGIGSIFQ
jgi:hypothetical protein